MEELFADIVDRKIVNLPPTFKTILLPPLPPPRLPPQRVVSQRIQGKHTDILSILTRPEPALTSDTTLEIQGMTLPAHHHFCQQVSYFPSQKSDEQIQVEAQTSLGKTFSNNTLIF